MTSLEQRFPAAIRRAGRRILAPEAQSRVSFLSVLTQFGSRLINGCTLRGHSPVKYTQSLTQRRFLLLSPGGHVGGGRRGGGGGSVGGGGRRGGGGQGGGGAEAG